VVTDTTGRTDRKLDAPEETLNLNARMVNQELGDEQITEGLADKMVGHESPVLSSFPARSQGMTVEISICYSFSNLTSWRT